MNQAVNEYMASSNAEQQAIMETIITLMRKEVPDATAQIKWGRPVFSKGKDFAYVKTAKTYLSLGFFNAGRISTQRELLEGTGKDMRHIKLRTAADVDSRLLTQWLKELTT